MAINALWNYVFFRIQNLLYSFVLSLLYGSVTIALFISLINLDTSAALALAPYLIYSLFALYWGYKLWKLNPNFR